MTRSILTTYEYSSASFFFSCFLAFLALFITCKVVHVYHYAAPTVHEENLASRCSKGKWLLLKYRHLCTPFYYGSAEGKKGGSVTAVLAGACAMAARLKK